MENTLLSHLAASNLLFFFIMTSILNACVCTISELLEVFLSQPVRVESPKTPPNISYSSLIVKEHKLQMLKLNTTSVTNTGKMRLGARASPDPITNGRKQGICQLSRNRTWEENSVSSRKLLFSSRFSAEPCI